MSRSCAQRRRRSSLVVGSGSGGTIGGTDSLLRRLDEEAAVAHLPIPLLDIAERQHGILSAPQLTDAGVSEDVRTRIVRAGVLERVLVGAYRVRGRPLDEIGRCAAVCLARPHTAIAGPTAGRIWGFRRLPRDRRVHVIAPRASQPCIAPWVVPYRTAAIHDRDVVERPDGIRLTSRARTAFDLCRTLGEVDSLSVIEQAMADGGVDASAMVAVAIDWLSPQRPFAHRYLSLIERRVAGGAAESHGEVLLGQALSDAGMVGLVRQFEIDLPGYGCARFDLAVPSRRMAIEVDLFPTHRETSGRERDRRRDAAAAQLGWSTTRLGPASFGTALPRTVADLLTVFRGHPATDEPLRR